MVLITGIEPDYNCEITLRAAALDNSEITLIRLRIVKRPPNPHRPDIKDPYCITLLETKSSPCHEAIKYADFNALKDHPDTGFDKELDSHQFIFYKMPGVPENGNGPWLLINWIPESTTNIMKTLYATSSLELKGIFDSFPVEEGLETGSYKVFRVITLGDREDMDWSLIYKTSIDMSDKDELRSKDEMTMFQIHDAEANERATRMASSNKKASNTVTFPFTSGAMVAFDMFHSEEANFVRLIVKDEKYQASASIVHGDISEADVPEELAYILYRCSTTQTVTVMAAYIPNETTAHDRFTFASGKAGICETLQSLGIAITKQMQIDAVSDISVAEMTNLAGSLVHDELGDTGFIKKVKRPGRR